MKRSTFDPESRQQTQSMGLWEEVIATKVYRISCVLAIVIVSVAMILPSKPDILTDFFASERAGRLVHCQDYAKQKEPEFCQNAHSDAVWWGSISDFVANSIVAFILAPLAGRWSDRLGRKAFIALFLGIGTVAPIILALHISYGLSLYFYFPAQAFAGHNALISLCSAYISDLVSPGNRAATMSLNLAGFMVAFILGPALGAFVGTGVAAWVAVFGSVLALAFLAAFVPESLSPAARDKAAAKQKLESKWVQAPWNCIRILGRNSLFLKLAIVVSIAGFVVQGFMELLAQYLQLKLKYTKLDLAVVMTVAGVSGLLTQTVVIRVLMLCMGETYILVFSLVARLVEQIVFYLADSRGVVIVALIFGALAMLMMPVSTTLLSKNSAAYEQGTAQGALYGVLALSQGLGPLAFAFLFSGFTRSDSTWGYIPGAPYLFGAVLTMICLVVACLIDRKYEAGIPEELAHYQEMPSSMPHPLAEAGVINPSVELASATSATVFHRATSMLGPTQKSSSLDLTSRPSSEGKAGSRSLDTHVQDKFRER